MDQKNTDRDSVRREADRLLVVVRREFLLAVGRASGAEIPSLTVLVTCERQAGACDKEHFVSKQVFDAFRLVCSAACVSGGSEPIIRVMSFEHSRHPWFDISVDDLENAFVLRVSRVYPIRELKNAV